LLALAISAPLPAQQAQPAQTSQKAAALEYPNPRPGQPGHRPHIEWQGAYPKAGNRSFRVVTTLRPPDGFIGNMTYDPASDRLYLVSLGKPTNTNDSSIYALDAATGKILEQARLPLIGDFGDPVFLDGYVYQPVYHESKMYKIAANGREPFGKVVKEIPLPTHADLNLTDESHPYPFIEFGGAGVTAAKKIIFHADDVGEFVTIEPETGKILARVRTIKALGGLESVAHNKRELVIANSDPRGGYCALSFPPALSRTPDQKDISWALLDARSGEVLASIRTQNSRAYAASVALKRYDPPTAKQAKNYGKFTFFAFGEEGILVMEWDPTYNAY
jgi:hypothetical protein